MAPLSAGTQGLDVYAQATSLGPLQLAARATRLVSDTVTLAPATPDAGEPDAGTNDAGHEDAGHEDAGTNDAGTNDAGLEDAGVNETPDAHHLKAGCDCSTLPLPTLLALVAVLTLQRRKSSKLSRG